MNTHRTRDEYVLPGDTATAVTARAIQQVKYDGGTVVLVRIIGVGRVIAFNAANRYPIVRVYYRIGGADA